jgi:hypothetical protein
LQWSISNLPSFFSKFSTLQDKIIDQLMSPGRSPKEKVNLEESDILVLCREAQKCFQKESTLVKVDAPVNVISERKKKTKNCQKMKQLLVPIHLFFFSSQFLKY